MNELRNSKWKKKKKNTTATKKDMFWFFNKRGSKQGIGLLLCTGYNRPSPNALQNQSPIALVRKVNVK